MFLGETDKQRAARLQREYARMANGFQSFRLIANLEDGRWAICEKLWGYLPCFRDSDGRLIPFTTDEGSLWIRWYSEQSPDHIDIRETKGSL